MLTYILCKVKLQVHYIPTTTQKTHRVRKTGITWHDAKTANSDLSLKCTVCKIYFAEATNVRESARFSQGRFEYRYSQIICTGKDSRGLRNFGLAYVHHVDPISRMYATHVGAHVRGMPRPVDAVRAIVPRWLAALDPPVVLQILLHAEHATTIAARKPHPLIVPVCDRPTVSFLPRVPQQRSWGSCKKKVHKTSSIKPVKITSSRFLNLYTLALHPALKEKKERGERNARKT